MYGMIHQAARQMVHDVAGAESWAAILKKSGLSEEHFVTGEQFDDELTFALIAAIQTHTGMPRDDLLEAFGRYWIKFTSTTSYGSMMGMAGGDLETFLQNLDRMHMSIKGSMPDATMPSFVVEEITPKTIKVRYRSSRDGLEMFVRGLLKGLMEKFGETGDISFTQTDDGVDFCIERDQAQAAA